MASSANRSARPSSLLTSPASLVTRFSSYLTSIPRPILFTFTFLTSSYILTTALLSQLLSIHNRINAESSSKEGLRSKFRRNLQDVDFTILALLPSLKAEMDKTMDLDAVTTELRTVGKEEQGISETKGRGTGLGQADSVDPAIPPSQSSVPGPSEADSPSQTASKDHSQRSSTSALDSIAEPRPDPILPQSTVNGDQRSERAQDHQRDGQTEPAQAQEVGQFAAEVTPTEGGDKVTALVDAEPLTATTNGEQSATDCEQRGTVVDGPASVQNGSGEGVANGPTALPEPALDSATTAAETAEDARISALKESQREEQQLLDRRRKTALWQQLKILTFTRALTAIYAVALLSVLTHIQLNLLGRYSYLRDLAGLELKEADREEHATLAADPFEEVWANASASVQAGGSSSTQSTSEAPEPSTKINHDGLTLSADTEERYLTFSYHFLHQGWKELGERVKEKVEEVMGTIPLKTQLSHEELTSILRRIRRKVEYDYEPEADTAAKVDDQRGSSATSQRPFDSARPYTFPGGHTLDETDSRTSMAFGSESLLPPNGFHTAYSGDEAKSEGGCSSVMSGSTTLSAAVNGCNGGRRNRRRRTRKRFDMLQAFLLPKTARGDLDLLVSAGLISTSPSSLEEVDPCLATLLDETRDLLESSDAQDVSRRCIQGCFERHLLDTLRPAFGLGPPITHPPLPFLNEPTSLPLEAERDIDGVRSQAQGRFSEITSEDQEAEIRRDPSMAIGRRLKLASLLPLLATRAKVALEGIPNEVVETIASDKDLQAFSAIIYTSFTSHAV